MGAPVTPEQEDVFWRQLGNGCSITEASRRARFNRNTGRALMKRSSVNGKAAQAEKRQRPVPHPVHVDKLCEEAKRALDDFGYFQRRYFGRIPVYWQREAAEKILGLLETPDEEYVVVNCPPGAGKSTLFMLDLPAWLTCRNRAIRGLMGSATVPLATWYTRRLRLEFERSRPLLAEADKLQKHEAYDAEACLAQDFGRFKPVDSEIWTADAFTVMQLDNRALAAKEYTWQAFSRDRDFIGGRFDIALWDDLQTLKRLRTLELIEDDRRWWDDIAEARLEPGGLLCLVGQRLGSEDLHRYNLDKLGYLEEDEPDDDDLSEEEAAVLAEARRSLDDGQSRKYHHILYKAHYDDLCLGRSGHSRTAPAYGEGGCCLYPARLPGRKLMGLRRNNAEGYEVVYQQGDVDPEAVLVRPEWVDGSMGFPGCWDHNRDRLEIPLGLEPPTLSVISCDPSASKYWALQWWLYHPVTEQRFLVDLERKKMEAPDFLDWAYNEGQFVGLLEEWWKTSAELGHPISHVIVESNACQRYLLQYDHTHRWMAKRSVEIIPHETHRNKSDPDFGVQTIAPHWKYGRVRLPGKANVGGIRNNAPGRVMSLKLVHEVTHYPKVSTIDCVMAQWFFEFQLPNIYRPESGDEHKTWVPSWMSGEQPAEQGKVLVKA